MKKLMNKTKIPNTVEAFACNCWLDECTCPCVTCVCGPGLRLESGYSSSVLQSNRGGNKTTDAQHMIANTQVR